MTVNRTFFSCALTGCFAIATMPALAQSEPPGFYVTAYAQASRLSSTSFDEIGNAHLGAGLKAEFDAGLGLGGDIGYKYGNGWAAEFEWNWRRHELKSLTRRGASTVNEGDFASNILFVNGLRHFTLSEGGWTPYVGLGVGWVQEIDFDINAGATERAWSKQGDIGVQLIGGVEFPLADAWSLTADVRLLRLGKHELTAEEGVTGRLAKPGYNPLSVQIGVRRRF
jgi:opacity protein-like surface antigen